MRRVSWPMRACCVALVLAALLAPRVALAGDEAPVDGGPAVAAGAAGDGAVGDAAAEIVAPAPAASVRAPDRTSAKAANAATAHPHPAPRNAVSVALVGLLSSALVVQYERWLPRPRVSLVTSAGGRTSGGNDFDTLEGTFGAEGRVWFVGEGPLSRFDERAMVGPYLGVRADFALTRVSRGGHVLGSSMALSPALMLGARVAVARRIALTPHIGFGFRTEWDPTGRLASWTVPDIFRFGVDLGVLF